MFDPRTLTFAAAPPALFRLANAAKALQPYVGESFRLRLEELESAALDLAEHVNNAVAEWPEGAGPPTAVELGTWGRPIAGALDALLGQLERE